jgi:hypothetical protein
VDFTHRLQAAVLLKGLRGIEKLSVQLNPCNPSNKL